VIENSLPTRIKVIGEKIKTMNELIVFAGKMQTTNYAVHSWQRNCLPGSHPSSQWIVFEKGKG
jgi:hypothetical protein